MISVIERLVLPDRCNAKYLEPEHRYVLMLGCRITDSATISNHASLCSTLLPSSGLEGQPVILSREGNGRALWEEEHISRLSLYFVACLVCNGVLT